jgi:ubiquinone/menaquinone biosynthesis C-methylase UbiE
MSLMDLRAILSHPSIYDLWSRLAGAERCRAIFVYKHVRPGAGSRMLDVGCGTADILRHLPSDADYVGIDISASYIAQARARHGERAEFRVGDVAGLNYEGRAFDMLIACGVLHHLDDSQARALFRDAVSVLTRNGRVVTIDPVFEPGQSRATRAIMVRDRGRYIRTSEAYLKLPTEAFASTGLSIHRGLLRLPYWHCVLECGEPISDSSRVRFPAT